MIMTNYSFKRLTYISLLEAQSLLSVWYFCGSLKIHEDDSLTMQM